MNKRLIGLAALAALWMAPADSRASSFGLTYSRQCNSCGFCVRPYNAFSSVTCGVANVGYGGGGCCNYSSFLGPNCHRGGWGHGHCGTGHCGTGHCGKFLGGRLRHRLFGKHPFVEPGDDEPGAFGGNSQEVAFFGSPANMKGYNPGCHMAWGWDNQPVNVPGHTPPSVYMTPPNPACTNVWLAPKPFPGVYGVGGYGHGYYPMPYQAAPAMQQGYGHGMAPVGYWYPGYGWNGGY